MKSPTPESKVRQLQPAAARPDIAPADHVGMVDERPEASIQRKLQDQATATVQRRENKTGLPDNLKSGIENLSGLAMDDVRVHRNSDKPAQLNAHAYAQGTDIHLAPGQEKHLAHEAWHVVQQKQGRVKPTRQLKGKTAINDDVGLEREADVMGAKAAHMNHDHISLSAKQLGAGGLDKQIAQRSAAIHQLEGEDELLSQEEVEEWAELEDYELEGLTDIQRKQVIAYKRANELARSALESVEKKGNYAQWTYDDHDYHINLKLGDRYHVTRESNPKIHYFFTGFGEDLRSAQPTKAERGKKGTSLPFNALDEDFQAFIRENFLALLG